MRGEGGPHPSTTLIKGGRNESVVTNAVERAEVPFVVVISWTRNFVVLARQ